MKSVSAQTTAGPTVGGTAEVDFTPAPGMQWMVYHIGISCAGTLPCICRVFLNQKFLLGSNDGTADSADGSPIPMQSNDMLRFVWSNTSPGAVVSVNMLVEEAVIGLGVLQSYGRSPIGQQQ